jgi:hypothetical protein
MSIMQIWQCIAHLHLHLLYGRVATANGQGSSLREGSLLGECVECKQEYRCYESNYPGLQAVATGSRTHRNAAYVAHFSGTEKGP